MKVLIGVDGSNHSWDALNVLRRLLVPTQDHVLVYFSPPHVQLSGVGQNLKESHERVRHVLADSVFSEALLRLPSGIGNQAETILGKEDPRVELPRLAAEHAAELMVIGARGIGPIQAVLLGSVSLALARHTRCPLLVARSKPDKASEPQLKVLVSVEGVPPTASILRTLNAIHWPPHTSARLMHVVENLFGTEVPNWLFEQAKYAPDEELARAYVEQEERTKREKFGQLLEYRSLLPPSCSPAPPIVLTGNPAERILETAASDDIDLIVMGMKHSTGLGRALLGSIAERVLTHAPCSVLLVPHD